jgi:hypothetical protein
VPITWTHASKTGFNVAVIIAGGVLFAALVAAMVSITPATRTAGNILPAYYVSASGSDFNRGAADAPFASLIKAQAAMQSSDTKTTYIRAGTYSGASLTLSAADSGETWSYYPPDGYDSAILDGGASSSSTGGNPITILGGSNITINGLLIQNFKSWGIGIHGGAPSAADGYPQSVATANSDTVTNNIITNGYTTANNGWAGGGLWAQGQVSNLTVANNVFTNQYGSGIRVGANGAGGSPNDNISGLRIKNNVLLVTDQYPGDNGAIYVQDQNFVATKMSITNNFIRDYQTDPAIKNANPNTRDVAIYLDRGASNVTVTGNIIANTANAVVGSTSVSSTQAFFLGSGHNDTITSNIIDLGNDGYILDLVYEHYYATDSAMAGNTFSGNILIGNWSGAQAGYALGLGPSGYARGSPGGKYYAPTITHNMYFNYGNGSFRTNGNGFGDASPVTDQDPLISGWTYSLAPDSPAFRTPVNFPAIVGGWGPPGYVIPQSGTAPSYAGSQ